MGWELSAQSVTPHFAKISGVENNTRRDGVHCYLNI
jgi:hypothetical protein